MNSRTRRRLSILPFVTGYSLLCSLCLVARVLPAQQSKFPTAVEQATSLTPAEVAVCEQLHLDRDQIEQLKQKRLFEFSEAEVDLYLKFLQSAVPNLSERVVHLARKNIGQPYELYLLGELPFEQYDPQPIYCLAKSDCLVFSEHTYAMALGNDWGSFMRLLQRIRYRDGQLGVATRNHFTEADWNPSNAWLVTDITKKIAGGTEIEFRQKIDRAQFLKKRYDLVVDIPIEDHVDAYLPYTQIDRAKPLLQNGDFVNIVRGRPGSPNETFGASAWVGHVGLIVQDDTGTIQLLHSSKPNVREESLDAYIAKSLEKQQADPKRAKLFGFKFLRLQSDPMAQLRKIDGPNAPRIVLPQ